MLLHRITRDAGDGAPSAPRAGWVVAREIPGAGADTGFAKGQVLVETDVPRLLAMPWRELHLIEPERGEIHEAEAGLRIAQAAAGTGVTVGSLAGGHWPLVAGHRGLLRVAVGPLTALNDIVGACVYTRFDGQIIDAGTTVARAKVTPLVLGADAVVRAERIARECDGLVRVAPFRPATIGVVVQETLNADAAARFTAALTQKVAWFGSRLLTPIFVQPSEHAIAAAIEDVIIAGATVVLLAGAKSLDPLDPAFLALQNLGVDLDRYGVPVHPGSLFWLGHLGRHPLIGLPTCGLFAQLTSFDLVFPRLLAGEAVDAHTLSALAHGGLLSREVSYFPPYTKQDPPAP